MRHVFIINPAAGKTDRTDEIREQINNLSTQEKVEVFITEGVRDAERIARREVSKGDEVRIYACGGDGTANEVLTGVQGYKNCAMGIIPIGSGNDFVRSLEPFKREDFLKIENMIKGTEKEIDLIECNGKYSMNIFSVGFDCSVANNVERFKKLPLVSGSLAYKMSIIYCLFAKRKHKVVIEVDGEVLEKTKSKTTLLTVGGNGQFYGGGIKAAPKALLDDGYIDFVHVSTIAAIRFIFLLGKYIKGLHINNPKFPFVTFKRCKEIKFISDETIDINVDGEIFPEKNPVARLSEKALRIVLPNVEKNYG